MNSSMVSIIIPAYNKPALLRRAIESILQQDYKPIQIIVCDDASPNSLDGIIETYESHPGITLEYHRNLINLGPYWNIREGRKYIEGKYLMIFPHDDYLIDRKFISNAVDCLLEVPNCNLVIGNSVGEDGVNVKMPISYDAFTYIDGNQFLTKSLWESLHPCYSAVLIEYTSILERGYDNFHIDMKISKAMNLEPDEFFISLVLAAEDSIVTVTGKVVSIRGNPLDSYSKSDFWRKRGLLSCFIPQYQLYNYFKKKNKNYEASVIARNIVIRHPSGLWSNSILKFFNYETDAIRLLALSFLFYYLHKLKNLHSICFNSLKKLMRHLLHRLLF